MRMALVQAGEEGGFYQEPFLKKRSSAGIEHIRCIETSDLLLMGRPSSSKKEERECVE
jgi:hypothetical protein